MYNVRGECKTFEIATIWRECDTWQWILIRRCEIENNISLIGQKVRAPMSCFEKRFHFAFLAFYFAVVRGWSEIKEAKIKWGNPIICIYHVRKHLSNRDPTSISNEIACQSQNLTKTNKWKFQVNEDEIFSNHNGLILIAVWAWPVWLLRWVWDGKFICNRFVRGRWCELSIECLAQYCKINLIFRIA